jgi:hypothetical protein
MVVMMVVMVMVDERKSHSERGERRARKSARV